MAPRPLRPRRGWSAEGRACLIAWAACLALAPSFAAAAPVDVLVLNYQALGLEPSAVDDFARALQEAVAVRGFGVADRAAGQRQQRAAVMCGEDRECLATLGQRSEARWVLAFGAAKLGAGGLLELLLLQSEGGAVLRRARFEEPLDTVGLANRAVEKLFEGLERPPPVVVRAPSTRPWALGTAGLSLVATGFAVGLGVAAGNSFRALPNLPVSERPQADARQKGLNAGADATAGVAIASGVAALVLFLVELKAGGAAPPTPGATSPARAGGVW